MPWNYDAGGRLVWRDDPAWGRAWSAANTTLFTITGTSNFTNPIIYTEAPSGGTIMGTLVTTIDQLAAAPAETLVTVARADGDIGHWLTDGKGGLTNKASGVTLPAREFRSAIQNETVHLIEPVKIGDTFGTGNRYIQVLAAKGDQWVLGKSGTHGGAATMETYVGDIEPQWVTTTPTEEAQKAFDILKKMVAAEETEARLQEILDHGEVPTNETYRVTIRATTTTAVLPNARQVGEMFGLDDVIITNIDAFDVTYHRDVTVVKRSRWGCACDQVTPDDVNRGLGGDAVSGWEILGCQPTRKGAESSVHPAAA